jgi:hypothetical protein
MLECDDTEKELLSSGELGSLYRYFSLHPHGLLCSDLQGHVLAKGFKSTMTLLYCPVRVTICDITSLVATIFVGKE